MLLQGKVLGRRLFLNMFDYTKVMINVLIKFDIK